MENHIENPKSNKKTRHSLTSLHGRIENRFLQTYSASSIFNMENKHNRKIL
jgi:hypothetical protein